MAAGIRFTKAERELIRNLLQWHEGKAARTELQAVKTAMEKLDRSELAMPKGAGGLSVNDAIAAFREVLGNRLVVLSSYGAGWYAQIGNRLKLLGLTRDDCIRVAKSAAAEWQGPIKAESLVRQAEYLLHTSYPSERRNIQEHPELEDL